MGTQLWCDTPKFKLDSIPFDVLFGFFIFSNIGTVMSINDSLLLLKGNHLGRECVPKMGSVVSFTSHFDSWF